MAYDDERGERGRDSDERQRHEGDASRRPARERGTEWGAGYGGGYGRSGSYGEAGGTGEWGGQDAGASPGGGSRGEGRGHGGGRRDDPGRGRGGYDPQEHLERLHGHPYFPSSDRPAYDRPSYSGSSLDVPYGGWGNTRDEAGLGEGPRPNFAGRGPKGYRRSDARIEEDVCESLTRDPYLDASEIEVRVERGEVILSGTVGDRRDKRRAEDLAAACSGVVDVRNEIRIARRGSARAEGAPGAEPDAG